MSANVMRRRTRSPLGPAVTEELAVTTEPTESPVAQRSRAPIQRLADRVPRRRPDYLPPRPFKVSQSNMAFSASGQAVAGVAKP